MKCQKCKRTVTRKSKFCAHCGSPVVHRSTPKKQSKPKLQPGYLVALLFIGALVGYGISKITSQNQRAAPISTVGGRSSAGSLSAQIIDIAREFNCPCGTCDHSLEVCSCEHPNGALEIKNFIAQLLMQTHKKPHIMEMVQAKYGGLKEPAKEPLKLDFPSN